MNPVLQPYMRLPEFLAASLGPDYEVVLSDISADSSNIVAISNSHISGRTVGEPLSEAQMKIFTSEDIQYREYVTHTSTLSSTGKTLRSSSFLIRDNGHLVGVLCINFDSSRYNDVIERILHLCHPSYFYDYRLTLGENGGTIRTFGDSSVVSLDPITSATTHQLDKMGLSAKHLSSYDRKRVISALNAEGIFKVKGAVKTVSQILGYSQASLYRYLSEMK